MTQSDAIKILLESMAVPDYARLEYFQNQQQASGYSMQVFIRFLTDAVIYLFNELTQPRFDPIGNQRPPIYSLPIFGYLKYVPASGPTHFGAYELKVMGDHLQQLVDTMQQAVKKRMAEIEQAESKAKGQPKPKHQPSEREREALYFYYMGTFPKKNEKLYNETLDWNKDDYRLHSNGSTKSYNSKRGHMEAVLIRVLSEKKEGWEKRRDRIQQDIRTLTENKGLKVPG